MEEEAPEKVVESDGEALSFKVTLPASGISKPQRGDQILDGSSYLTVGADAETVGPGDDPILYVLRCKGA